MGCVGSRLQSTASSVATRLSTPSASHSHSSIPGVTWCNLQKLDEGGKHPRRTVDPDAKQSILRRYLTFLKQMNDKGYDPTDSDVLYYRHSEAKEGEQLQECGHGFYSAFETAWATHGSVVVSPDDVWLAVQLQFCKYMDANAEQLRSVFVDHEGKVELHISMESTGLWELFMRRTMSAIQDKCKANVKADFLPDFSSSTELSSALQRLAVMDCMQHYFTYRYGVLCGIERVGFTGTLNDWQKLRSYVLGLARFHLPNNSKYFTSLQQWVDAVVVIIDHFIIAYEGKQKPSLDFWNRIINMGNERGSGDGGPYIHGWITTFLSGGHFTGHMDVQQIPALRYNVPVTVDDNGCVYRVRVMGGFTGVEQVEAGVFRPQTSLVVVKVGNGEEPEGRVNPSPARCFPPM